MRKPSRKPPGKLAKRGGRKPAKAATQRAGRKPAASARPRGKAAPPPRAGSKQAAVIALLRRPQGATNAQIEKATNWQAHTCRAILTTLRGAGLAITSSKEPGGVRVYRAPK